jgi:hypothetical protein
MKINLPIIIAMVAVLIVVVVVVCSFIQSPSNNNIFDIGVVKCTTTQCLHAEFLKCNPSELKMPFAEGLTYVIDVYGLNNMICHYDYKLEYSNGSVLGEVKDCNVQMYNVTEDTFGHLFGEDKEAGKEEIKAKQDQIEADSCAYL